jgi:peptidoglycan/LPS O-acetylase OafA/YrhL
MDVHVEHRAFLARKYFGALDGLRGISIIAVVWHHAAGHDLPGVLGRGYLGVHLFFAISGLLITTLLLREQSRSGTISLRNFYIRRTLRIFPAYYAVIVVYAVLVFLVDRHSAAGIRFFSNLPYFLTYTSNWYVIKANWFLGYERIIFYYAWSLATEEQFYLFWPSVVRIARRWYAPIAFMILLMACGEVSRWAIATRRLDPSPLAVRMISSVATPICMGCLAAYLLHREAGYRFARRIAGQSWSAPLAVVFLVAVCSFEAPMLLVAAAMTFLVTACVVRPDNALRRVLEQRVLTYVGTVSYGMYLLHMLAINAVHRMLPRVSPVASFALALPLAVLLAGLSYRYFEQRFLALKERFTRGPGPAMAAVTPRAPASAAE